MITSISGGEPVVGSKARRLKESAENGPDRERTMYRVDHDVFRCPVHADATDTLLPGFKGDSNFCDPGSPGIKDPEPISMRRTRVRLLRPDLHLIAGLDG